MLGLNSKIFFGYYLEKNEWRKVKSCSDAHFLGIPGSGTLQMVYERVWWPSVFRLLVTGLPLSLVGLYLLIDAAVYTRWSQAFAADWFYILVSLFPLFFYSIILVLGVLELWHIYWSWPTQTPAKVAVFSNGIVWIENGSVQLWVWKQMKVLRKKDAFLYIENQSGREMRFHHVLAQTEFGIKALIATGQIPDPDDLIVCPTCGKENIKETPRCLYCLQPIYLDESKRPCEPCPICGAIPQSEEDRFCRDCGTELRGPLQQPLP